MGTSDAPENAQGWPVRRRLLRRQGLPSSDLIRVVEISGVRGK